MQKRMKCVLVAAACILLTGCPKATAVTGSVTAAVGSMAVEYLTVGSFLSPARTYHVLAGASITVTYDNGKTCTFNGPTEFIPGNDGSVCQQDDDNDDRDRKDKKDKKDEKDQQQDQQQQQQDQQQASQEQSQATQQEASTSGDANQASQQAGSSGTTSGSTATTAGSTGTAAGTAGTTTALGTSTGLSVLQTSLIAIGGAAAGKAAYDEIKGNDPPVSK